MHRNQPRSKNPASTRPGCRGGSPCEAKPSPLHPRSQRGRDPRRIPEAGTTRSHFPPTRFSSPPAPAPAIHPHFPQTSDPFSAPFNSLTSIPNHQPNRPLRGHPVRPGASALWLHSVPLHTMHACGSKQGRKAAASPRRVWICRGSIGDSTLPMWRGVRAAKWSHQWRQREALRCKG